MEKKIATTNPVKTPIHESHLSEIEPKWFAIRTRFKSEKLAHKQLIARQIDAYLPIRHVLRRYGRKKREIDLPLINNFVFVKILKKDYLTVLQTEYVNGFLKLGHNLLSIPEEQIELIRRLLGENVTVELVENQGLEKGDWVEVTMGPLLGLQGRLVQVKGKEKVIVELITSGYSLEISIDNQLLAKINKD
jgi:transcription antitermination factor NusG